MEHLESKKVIHGDLAARNILLTSTLQVKVTDFGLSRRMYAYAEYVKKSKAPLPWRWMALESLQQMSFSSKSDVWSYGITLWEIFTLGDIPYPGLSWSPDFPEMLEAGMRPKKPDRASDEM
jgi:FMS-like tyrosine kinase 4